MEEYKIRQSLHIQPPEILLIGSSTGGLNALATLFSSMKEYRFDIPILITQHIPNQFDKSFIEKISKSSNLPCKVAEDGEEIQKGHIYLAPSGLHMKIESILGKVIIKLFDGEQINFCKPAVDPMLKSAAKIYGKGCMAVILTGIGSDGLEGCREIVEKSGTVIAQDKKSSIVWGMPGAVAKEGLCSAILDIKEIGNFLKEYSFGKIR